MRWLIRGVVALVLLLLAVAWMLTPAALVNPATVPALPEDLDGYLAARELGAGRDFPLIRGTEKRLRWASPGARTRYSVVYLPGFSATRQEIAPVPELVADALGANLFETRLAGHGRVAGAMLGVYAEDWLADAAEALAIGSRIGERVVVIGTSTGATLAMAMAGHPAAGSVETMVLVSPNFRPADRRAGLVTGPAGPLLARLLIGETRSWTPHNELQARYWATKYPVDAAVEVMRLVDFTWESLPLDLPADLLVFYSPNDTVVSPAATLEALEQVHAHRKRLLAIESAGDPSNHVLAGDVLSPDRTDEVAAAIVAFIHGDSPAAVPAAGEGSAPP
jgi:esterase/lipase